MQYFGPAVRRVARAVENASAPASGGMLTGRSGTPTGNAVPAVGSVAHGIDSHATGKSLARKYTSTEEVDWGFGQAPDQILKSVSSALSPSVT